MKAALFALSSLFAVSLFGQANSGAGDLAGAVSDPNGGAIANATVVVSDPLRGFRREFQTGAEGRYHASVLQPGRYQIVVSAPGFATSTLENAEVRVGETTTLNASLQIGAVTTRVEVSAELPPVDTTRTQQASSINTQRLEELPINQRNYLDLALTTPGVVETADMVDGTDYRVVQTPQSGLSFGGGNGRGNGFYIDGAENYSNSGGVRPSVSQEAVQEFQINRNSFGAEFGDAAGGVINIVTKAGTNDTHGDIFGFLRDSAFQARNFFDPGKASYTRGQYGGTLGGALKKDRTFYFLAFERLERHETAFVPIFNNPAPFYSLTPSQQSLVGFFEGLNSPTFAQLGQQLQTALTPASNPMVLSLFQANSGEFPFSEAQNQGSLRVDHRFSDKDLAFLRANITTDDNQNSALGALIGYNRGRAIDTFDGTVMLSNTYIFSPAWVSESHLMYGYYRNFVVPNDSIGPEIDVEGFGYFGRDIFLPANTYSRHYELAENLNYTSGRHSVKFGVDINPTTDAAISDTFFSGRFQFGPIIPLAALIDAQAGSSTAASTLGLLLTAAGQPALAASLNNPVTSLQAFALGAPLYYQQGFGNPNWAGVTGRFGFFGQDSFKLTPKLTLNAGLRYDIEVNPTPVPAQFLNFGPRFGFAWSPFDDGKTVLRGGYGLFFSRIDAQEANVAATLNGTQIAQVFVTAQGQPQSINPKTGLPVTAIDIWQGLLAEGIIGSRSIQASDLAQFGLLPGNLAPDRVVFGIDKHFVDPYAHQASLELEHAFGSYAVSISTEFNHGLHEPRSLDENLYYTGRNPATGQPTYGFFNPDITQFNVLQSTAQSWYNAMIVQVTRRYSNHFTLNAHYTLSKAEDEATDFNSDFEPNDQLNAQAEKALSSFDQRHRIVGTAIFDSRLEAGAHSLAQNILGNWVLSPIVTYNSGRPFNILVGYDDVGDNHDTTHRPWGFGRNVGRGPDFVTADLRLSRKFLFNENRRQLEFVAEGFNLLNRTNFRTLNNVVGTPDPSQVPRPLQGHIGDVLEPFAFTSAYDPRQFQFALKFYF